MRSIKEIFNSFMKDRRKHRELFVLSNRVDILFSAMNDFDKRVHDFSKYVCVVLPCIQITGIIIGLTCVHTLIRM